jgi:hypothetical protein
VVRLTELPLAVPLIGLKALPLGYVAVPENEPDARLIEVILNTCEAAPPDPQQDQEPLRLCVVLAVAEPGTASMAASNPSTNR